MSDDALGDRMKGYENKVYLTKRLPVILRLDGRAFHSFTHGLDKPFDSRIIEMLDTVATVLCKDAQNCRLAYVQSDEISIVMLQATEDSMPWFDNELQKICSISASVASAVANRWLRDSNMDDKYKKKLVMFDARAFVLPSVEEVVNYLIWRQQDWERNSVQMLSRSHYSQKDLHKKDIPAMHELLYNKGVNWADLPTSLKRGRCAIKVKTCEKVDNPAYVVQCMKRGIAPEETVERSRWLIDNEIPVFTKNREYIVDYLGVTKS